jgi:hypothetical protein
MAIGLTRFRLEDLAGGTLTWHPRYFVGCLDSGRIQKPSQHSFAIFALEIVQNQTPDVTSK